MKKIIISLAVCLLLSESASAAQISGKVTTRKIKSPKEIVVYIEQVPGKEFSPPPEPLKMDQKNLVFMPRVLPVLKGTTVDFHNSDNLIHNVFGVGVEDFDMGNWGQNQTRQRVFNILGDVAILCNVHPEMEAYIFVLQNPYFGLTDEEGNYQIKDVPPGKYRLKTYNDKLKPQSKDVTISSESETITIDFTLK